MTRILLILQLEMESLKSGLEQMEVEEGCRSGTGVEEAPRRDEASVGENERTVEGGGGGIKHKH